MSTVLQTDRATMIYLPSCVCEWEKMDLKGRWGPGLSRN